MISAFHFRPSSAAVIRALLAAALFSATASSQFAFAADARVESAAAQSASARLAALADAYYEAQARNDPIYATLVGDNRFDDKLSMGIVPAQRKKQFAMLHLQQQQLAAIDKRHLGRGDALTYELLERELRTRIGFEPFSEHLLPLDQLDALPLILANFGGGQAEQPLKTPAQYGAYLKRIAALPAWTNQAIANMREGMRTGVVPPKSIVIAALAQVRTLGTETLSDNPFYAPIKNLPSSFLQSDRERLTAAYRHEVKARVAPSMRKLARFVENDYLPAARETAGWGGLPNGAQWYRQCVRDQTTTDLSPEEIHALGLKEVERIHTELAKVAPKLGFEGDAAGLLAWMRTNEKLRPFRSEAQILDTYRAINTRVKVKLPELFGHSPKAPLDVRPEPELTKAAASDHYSLPAADGSRPGIFWAVINDPAEYDSSTMTALFLHEGQPGHHFQMALQQEMDLPKFRKRSWINAYGEGWALYAETLGHELGLFDDPVAYAGELRLEMLRASRLVVDTGLHAKGWSREKAIAYWTRNVGTSEDQARNQIDRYMAWPAQALGYKLGSLKIQELRERARAQLGDKFDIASFHDAVLAEGSLPLSLLDAQIDRWIQSRR